MSGEDLTLAERNLSGIQASGDPREDRHLLERTIWSEASGKPTIGYTQSKTRYRPPGGQEAVMTLRSHRRSLPPWNLSTPAGKSRAARPARPRRLRRWLRTAALLSVIGMRRLARTRWQPVFLVTGASVFVIGLMLRSSVAFMSGMLVMGSAVSDTMPRSPTAAMVHMWMRLHKGVGR